MAALSTITPDGPPHVTVITVVRNARATLPATIESVLAQTHRPLDYLILDGASTDGTLDLLRAHEGRLRFESAPDAGIYDAMNRAVARVERRDSYLFFLNADDRFVAPDAVARVVAGGQGADFVHCLLEWRDDALRTREIVGGPVSLARLRRQNRCGHQMIFCRRSVFDAAGTFDLFRRAKRLFREEFGINGQVRILQADFLSGSATDCRTERFFYIH